MVSTFCELSIEQGKYCTGIDNFATRNGGDGVRWCVMNHTRGTNKICSGRKKEEFFQLEGIRDAIMEETELKTKLETE